MGISRDLSNFYYCPVVVMHRGRTENRQLPQLSLVNTKKIWQLTRMRGSNRNQLPARRESPREGMYYTGAEDSHTWR